MNRERARRHLQFLEKQVLPTIVGETFIYAKSKSGRKRKQGSVTLLIEAAEKMEAYAQQNKDLVELYALATGKSVHLCYHFPYESVERDVQEMIDVLHVIR